MFASEHALSVLTIDLILDCISKEIFHNKYASTIYILYSVIDILFSYVYTIYLNIYMYLLEICQCRFVHNFGVLCKYMCILYTV